MPKQLSVKVTTMDAELEFAIQANTTGKQLFDQVTKTINIREVWWFGLQYEDTKNFTTWLKLKNKVTAQDVPHTKEGGPLQFRFRARYFPEDASEELIQEPTQRMFFLQVKDAILRDEIFCPPDTSVLLASYACQAKFEDYHEGLNDVLLKERLLSQRVMEQHNLTWQEWVDKIINWYKDHNGMMKEDAMVEYLKIAQDLEMYGVNYFEIKNKKGTDLFLGVDALGLNIYELQDKLTPKIGFPWSEIRNISFREKKFIIQSVDKKAPDFIFFTPRVRVNKRILALCMGNHELYMRRRKEDSIEIQQMRSQAKEEHLSKQLQRQRLLREREAREDAERRLLEVEERLRVQSTDFESTQRALSEYEQRVRQLEQSLDEEARMRRELEEMQLRLEENNRALEIAKNSTASEYERLLEENRVIANEISAKNEHMLRTQRELEEQQKAMENLREEREALEAKARQLEEAMLVKEDDLEDDRKEYGQDLQCMANGHLNRNEEDRYTAIGQNQSLQDKLKSLSNDLRVARDENKMQQSDRLHEENQRQGRDKFKTLKQIRQGNTKRRVDQFEAL